MERKPLPPVTRLIVEAEVRYWEDASVNGHEDTDGSKIPCREGDLWKPVIELATGKIIGWPQGTKAEVHYKVCDAGQYWLGGDDGKKLVKWTGDYVPDDLIAGGSGYGDYIIMEIDYDGQIMGWRQPVIDADDWESVSQD